MAENYYIDTSIWIDMYEDRKGYNNEPLGDYAAQLFLKIRSNGCLVISDILIKELELQYSVERVNGMMKIFETITEKIAATESQREEAFKIAKEREIPPGDVLHAILARDHKLILITRDKHFRQLSDIASYYKPEELI